MALTHEVRLGDCLDPVAGLASLADRSIDHVITDPPYTEHVHRAQRRLSPTGVQAWELDFSAITPDYMTAIARELARVVRRWVIVFCAAEQIGDWHAAITDAGLEHVRVGAWVKTHYLPQFTGDRPAAGFESIMIAHQPPPGRKRWNRGGESAVWTGPLRDGHTRHHPTQKPLWLMEALVRDFTEPGDVILDPFAGSGTTGVACKRLGRGFVGWERDERYHAIAEKRIANTHEQLDITAAGAGAGARAAAKPRQGIT